MSQHAPVCDRDRGLPVGDAGPGFPGWQPLPDRPEDGDGPRLELMPSGDGRQLLLHSLAQLLEDPDALKPPEPVIPRIAYRARTTLGVGREKLSGKSTLLTAGAAAVTREGEFLGERCLAGHVLWASADQEHASEIVQRAKRFDADPDRFHVLWPREAFPDLMASLDRLDPFPILVVIDTLANFARVEDPHSSAEWPNILMPLVRIARDLNAAVVLTHHATKAENGGYRDSTAIGAIVDLILELQADAGNPARRHVKALGRWPVPNFTVDLVGDRYQLVAAGELSLDAQALVYVEQHPRCSLRALRSGVGGRADDVDAALGRLLTSGVVRNDGSDNRHAYVVTTTAAEPGRAPEDPDAPPF